MKAPVALWKTFVRSKTFSHEVEFLEENDQDEEDGSGSGSGGDEGDQDDDGKEGIVVQAEIRPKSTNGKQNENYNNAIK